MFPISLEEIANEQSAVQEEADGLAAERSQGHRRAHAEADAWAGLADGFGSGRGDRGWNLCALWTGSALRRARLDALIHHFRAGVRVRGVVLRGICGADSAGGQRLHLCLRRTWRINRVDHRVGLDPG